MRWCKTRSLEQSKKNNLLKNAYFSAFYPTRENNSQLTWPFHAGIFCTSGINCRHLRSGRNCWEEWLPVTEHKNSKLELKCDLGINSDFLRIEKGLRTEYNLGFPRIYGTRVEKYPFPLLFYSWRYLKRKWLAQALLHGRDHSSRGGTPRTNVDNEDFIGNESLAWWFHVRPLKRKCEKYRA